MMKKVVVLFIVVLFASVTVSADEAVEYDFIVFDEKTDYGENSSLESTDTGFALSLTEARFDISGKSITGDVLFELVSEESAEITVVFSGDEDSVLSYVIPSQSHFIVSARKDDITGKAGNHPETLTIRSDKTVKLVRVTSSRVPQSLTVPVTLTSAFLLIALLLPVLFYAIKRKRANRKRFI